MKQFFVASGMNCLNAAIASIADSLNMIQQNKQAWSAERMPKLAIRILNNRVEYKKTF